MMKELIERTKRFIREIVETHPRPSVLSSFGKDSMVMLHLLREMKIELPVIYHRDPWFPEKNKFADCIIEAWRLVVHDWPPSAVGIKCNGKFETVARYQVGPESYMDIPKNIIGPKHNERFACGLNDIIGRPKASFYHPWDLYLHGHRSCDVDDYIGPVPLKTEYVAAHGGYPAVAFPLKDWTDADIWNYIRIQRVPVQGERYNRETGQLRPEHARHSNDYITACVRCIDPREPALVPCPKLEGDLVPNVSGRLYRFDELPSYIEKESSLCHTHPE